MVPVPTNKYYVTFATQTAEVPTAVLQTSDDGVSCFTAALHTVQVRTAELETCAEGRVAGVQVAVQAARHHLWLPTVYH